MKLKIVSGGQTGVDRAVLDAALQFHIPCGGYCPEGRKAEDGAIPNRYPLTELAGADYTARTERNVIESDGTVIIYFDTPSGGTEKTLSFCLRHGRPYLLIDASELSPLRSSERLRRFIGKYAIVTANIAGPRASEEALAYPFALEFLSLFFSQFKCAQNASISGNLTGE